MSYDFEGLRKGYETAIDELDELKLELDDNSRRFYEYALCSLHGQSIHLMDLVLESLSAKELFGGQGPFGVGFEAVLSDKSSKEKDLELLSGAISWRESLSGKTFPRSDDSYFLEGHMFCAALEVLSRQAFRRFRLSTPYQYRMVEILRQSCEDYADILDKPGSELLDMCLGRCEILQRANAHLHWLSYNQNKILLVENEVLNTEDFKDISILFESLTDLSDKSGARSDDVLAGPGGLLDLLKISISSMNALKNDGIGVWQ